MDKKIDNVYSNERLGLKLVVPGHVCSQCDSVVYEPKEYSMILEAEEAVQGRSYIKVEIKHGKVNKYSVH